MFGNNINGPFMSPNMSYGIMRGAPMMNAGNTAIMGMRGPEMMSIGNTPMMGTAPRSGGLLGSLLGGNRTGGLLSGARTFNFGNLLNNTSKALGVVRDAIPIVKEVGPMMGNMKSILKIASVFKDETDTRSTNTNITETTTKENIITNENDTRITSTTTNNINNEPNFFL